MGMVKYLAVASDKLNLEPYEISRTLRGQLHYFTQGEIRDSEKPNDYFFPIERTTELLDAGVFYLVSPLDDRNRAEIEITAEQEDLLAWLVSNEIERVHVSET
jgi:hypothetical protein